ncbi:uncharacterized protein LOC105695899 isoform X3 [Orussus abietinus]|uniref:uncharacterized protein LOC105695899 isoform X3 n=1 Tax=Orussus abietinus TaxID=222816 RepID=UPI000626AE3A|nr:uncharacterized protein LOC105695899 isoform X3 [Orussus abietinus]
MINASPGTTLVVIGLASGICFLLIRGLRKGVWLSKNQRLLGTLDGAGVIDEPRQIPSTAKSQVYVTGTKYEDVSPGRGVATGGEEEGHPVETVRDFVENIVEGLIANVEDIPIDRPYEHSAYKPARDTPTMAHTALRELVERAVDEARKLPGLGGQSTSESISESQDIPEESYEGLLATAILNKVIEKYQNEHVDGNSNVLHGKSSPKSKLIKSEVEIGLDEGVEEGSSSLEPLSQDEYSSDCSVPPIKRVRNRQEPLSLTIEERIEEVTTYSSEEDRENGESNGLDFRNARRVPFPELGMDIVDPSQDSSEDELISAHVDLVTPVESWEENWLFQRRKIQTQSESVAMLVPNPSADFKALIGDKDAEDTSDLSEISAQSDEEIEEELLEAINNVVPRAPTDHPKRARCKSSTSKNVRNAPNRDSGLKQRDGRASPRKHRENINSEWKGKSNGASKDPGEKESKKVDSTVAQKARKNQDLTEEADTEIGIKIDVGNRNGRDKANVAAMVHPEVGEEIGTGNRAKGNVNVSENACKVYQGTNESLSEVGINRSSRRSPSTADEAKVSVTSSQSFDMESATTALGESNVAKTEVKLEISETVEQFGTEVKINSDIPTIVEESLEGVNESQREIKPSDDVEPSPGEGAEDIDVPKTPLSTPVRNSLSEETSERNLPCDFRALNEKLSSIDSGNLQDPVEDTKENPSGDSEENFLGESSSNGIENKEENSAEGVEENVPLENGGNNVETTEGRPVKYAVKHVPEENGSSSSIDGVDIKDEATVSESTHESKKIDLQNEEGVQRESEYTEHYDIATQRRMDSLTKTSDREVEDTNEVSNCNEGPTLEDGSRGENNTGQCREATLLASSSIEKEVDVGIELAAPPRPGTIAEREHKKWENAPPIENNPYSEENIQKRLWERRYAVKSSEVSGNHNDTPKNSTAPLQIVLGGNQQDYKRFGRDYYINDANATTGQKSEKSAMASFARPGSSLSQQSSLSGSDPEQQEQRQPLDSELNGSIDVKPNDVKSQVAKWQQNNDLGQLRKDIQRQTIAARSCENIDSKDENEYTGVDSMSSEKSWKNEQVEEILEHERKNKKNEINARLNNRDSFDSSALEGKGPRSSDQFQRKIHRIDLKAYGFENEISAKKGSAADEKVQRVVNKLDLKSFGYERGLRRASSINEIESDFEADDKPRILKIKTKSNLTRRAYFEKSRSKSSQDLVRCGASGDHDVNEAFDYSKEKGIMDKLDYQKGSGLSSAKSVPNVSMNEFYSRTSGKLSEEDDPDDSDSLGRSKDEEGSSVDGDGKKPLKESKAELENLPMPSVRRLAEAFNKTPEARPIPAPRISRSLGNIQKERSTTPEITLIETPRQMHSLTARSLSKEFREGLKQIPHKVTSPPASHVFVDQLKLGENKQEPVQSELGNTTDNISVIVPGKLKSNIQFWEQLHKQS